MTAGEEEVSSECLSNVPPLSGLCYRQRRCAIEACSPCISTELTASKFDERGCRGRFSDAAEAGFRTPLPMCHSSDLAGVKDVLFPGVIQCSLVAPSLWWPLK